jgi:hypothetical protein
VLKLLLVVAVFALVTYAMFRLLERRSGSGSAPTAGGGPSRSRGTAPRPVAPDDDEDFLRWLDRKRRKDPPD